MATPPEVIDQLRHAVYELDKAVRALNFDKATLVHGHIDDLLDDLRAASVTP